MYGSNLIKSCLQRVRLWIHEIFYGFTYGLNNGILSRSHLPLLFIRTVSNGKHQFLKAAFWWKGSVYMIRKTQWNSGLSSVFSTLVVGENAEMATVFLSYMFRSSLAFVAVASRISVSVMGHSEFCVLSWAVFDKGAGQNNNPVSLWVSASTSAMQKESWDWCFAEHLIFLVPTGEFFSTGLHHYHFHTGPTCNAVLIKTLWCVILFIYILKKIQLEKM